jgi:hypothetical protein
MSSDLLASLDRLTDAGLVEGLRSALSRERHAAAEVVAHLVLVERRRLHVAAGFDSMWSYCTTALSLSEPETALRLEVARWATRYPAVLPLLAEGALHMSGIRLLGPLLSADNADTVLQAARGRSKRAIEEMAAALKPKADVPTVIRKLPETRVTSVTVSAVRPAQVAPDAPARPPRPPARAGVDPLSPDRYRLQLTIDAETRDMLQEARDLLSHTLARGDDLALFKRALRTLLDDLSRAKYASTKHEGRRKDTAPHSRHIPSPVRRAVWARDRGCCAFVGHGGRRCGSRHRIEFHHVTPYMAGGPATVENIELRCRLCRARHNRHYADSRIMPTEFAGTAPVRRNPQFHSA